MLLTATVNCKGYVTTLKPTDFKHGFIRERGQSFIKCYDFIAPLMTVYNNGKTLNIWIKPDEELVNNDIDDVHYSALERFCKDVNIPLKIDNKRVEL